MNEKISKEEKQEIFLKGDTASLFPLYILILFRMIVLRHFHLVS